MFRCQCTLARALGRSESTVRSWYRRDSIPPEWFPRIGEVAQALDVPLTTSQLSALYRARLAERVPE